MNEINKKMIEIGKISKPQGIRGEVKVVAFTDNVNRFYELKQVYIQGENAPRKILNVRLSGEDVFLSLSGVADRNAAEGLREKLIYVEKDEAVKLEDGQYFISELIGAKVFSEDEKTIHGEIVEILQHGSADVFVLNTKKMFPHLKDVVKNVDIENKKIVVIDKRFNEVMVCED